MSAPIYRILRDRPRRWVVVIDYGHHGGLGRQGIWARAIGGGWRIADSTAGIERELHLCESYRTLREAREAVEEMEARS